MWTELLKQAKSQMSNSAKASKRQQNLIDNMAGKLEDYNKTEFSQPPLQQRSGTSTAPKTLNA